MVAHAVPLSLVCERVLPYTVAPLTSAYVGPPRVVGEWQAAWRASGQEGALIARHVNADLCYYDSKGRNLTSSNHGDALNCAITDSMPRPVCSRMEKQERV